MTAVAALDTTALASDEAAAETLLSCSCRFAAAA